MVINLKKGQTINLKKDQHDLSSVTIGLGWDVAEKNAEDYDLDAVAFLLNGAGKVTDTGNNNLVGGDVIYYHSLRHPSGNIYHTGDNLTGDGGEGEDDEKIIVNLDRMEPKYEQIVFLVSIYKGQSKKQHFGKVDNAFIRAVDAGGREIFRYDLSREETFEGKCSMVFGELYRQDGGWQFRAIGLAYATDRFDEILNQNYL